MKLRSHSPAALPVGLVLFGLARFIVGTVGRPGDWRACCPFAQVAEEADEAAALLARAEEALQALQTDSGAGGALLICTYSEVHTPSACGTPSCRGVRSSRQAGGNSIEPLYMFYMVYPIYIELFIPICTFRHS